MRFRTPSLRPPFALVALGLALALVGCAAGTGGPAGAPRPRTERAGTRAPEPDSITAGLWRFDESGGQRAADAGPFRLDGVAGVDTRTDFGRLRNARHFTSSLESFVFVPYSPALDAGTGLTVEAWIRLGAYGSYEDTPIAARWTPVANQQSWLFSVVGDKLSVPLASVASPGWHTALVQNARRGQLLFAFQPEPASPPYAFTSTATIELGRWVHVGVTYDGSVVRFYIDGHPEAQYASHGTIRRSEAPLLIGNEFDPRGLSDFGGDLRADRISDRRPYYAFDGDIDELRISTAARTTVDPTR